MSLKSLKALKNWEPAHVGPLFAVLRCDYITITSDVFVNFLIDEKINASLNSFECPLIVILFHFFLYLDQFLFKRGGGENDNTYITHAHEIWIRE